MVAAFWADMRASVSFFGMLVFFVFAFGVWIGVPTLIDWLCQAGYAAYARLIGLPKPEEGYRLELEGNTVLCCWIAFAMWSVWWYAYLKKNYSAVVEWITPIDIFAG